MDPEPALVGTPSNRSARGAGSMRATPDDRARIASMPARGPGFHKEKYRRLLDQFETDKSTQETRIRQLTALHDKETQIQDEINALLQAIEADTLVLGDPSLMHYAGSDDPFDLSFLLKPPPPRDPRVVPPEAAFNEYFARNDRGVIPRAHHHIVLNGHRPPG